MEQIFTMDIEKDINSGLEFAKLIAKYKRKGEFYITGRLVEKHPQICREIAKNHVMGGHGYDHENFAKLSYKEAEMIIKKTIGVFKKNKINIEGWRFPGFKFKNAHLKILLKYGLYDSSIKDKVIKRWGKLIFIRNLLSNIKRGSFFIPVTFPRKLDERPWSVVDLNDPLFYEKEGRLVTHCYHFIVFKGELKKYLERIH